MTFKATTIKLLVVAALVVGPIFPTAATLALFSAEGQAQQYCPSDVVVWLNLPSHIYHWKGMRWYGNTKNGAYPSLSKIAFAITGTCWNGPKFFGLRDKTSNGARS